MIEDQKKVQYGKIDMVMRIKWQTTTGIIQIMEQRMETIGRLIITIPHITNQIMPQ